MKNQGLLFIPDISGFSRFVSETEIEHSRLIIQELLEILINANALGLEISEIEGDAILFYKFGDPPRLDAITSQVEHMFRAFHQSLLAYDQRRYCQCSACTAANTLTLKVITHYGEFTSYTVRNFSKLIGKDLIVAHQLLKNDIPQHEYWLVTDNLMANDPPSKNPAQWIAWNASTKQTENGEIAFQYTQLGPLKKELSADTLPQEALASKAKAFSLQHTYDVDIITLFHATGDFNNRPRWQQGLKSIAKIGHFLPRVGMKCEYVLNNGKHETVYANSYRYNEDRIEFSELNEGTQTITYFTLEKITPTQTKLTIDFYTDRSFIPRTLFQLFGKGNAKRMLDVSLGRLDAVAKSIHLKK